MPQPGETQPAEAEWGEPQVKLSDARSLRAFAHPLRIALLEALRTYGPLTATQAAGHVDDTPSNCSFHLRTLGAFGVIEQCESTDGRQRPWQTVKGMVSIDADGSAEARMAMATALEVIHANMIKGLNAWVQRADDAPEEWQNAWWDASLSLSLTSEELHRINRQITGILKPYADRRNEREPLPGEALVKVATYAYPSTLPPAPAGTPE